MYWGKRVRYRPVKDVVQEILKGHRDLGITRFHCIDDNIGVNKDWLLEFCARSREFPEEINISFAYFSIKTLDDEVLQALKEMGVERIGVGIESGSTEVQKMVRKNLNLEQAKEKIARIRAMGFEMITQWMIGFPHETLEQIQQTAHLARELRSEIITVFPVFPFPGTRMYEEGKAEGIIALDEDDFESMDYQHAGKILSPEWDGETLSQIAYDLNIELNFLNTRLWDTPKGRAELKGALDALAPRLPGHVVLHICRGYLCGEFLGDPSQRESDYSQAFNILEKGSPTFQRYLSWEFPAIDDFRKWLRQTQREANWSFSNREEN